ncbi:hypothetical protein KUCAC02_003616 [Chaenocephalus aceratus]|uniref:Uncharacterized protein n=1 Tax=Chaenocephalus aceratus TaxID=36190 RepID=A0ACB9WM81_CHAAC|nr:hypothetical protein KUCAC02_003616 [Chaenocephalus aceratus]
MGQQRPKVEGAEFLESSSLILFVEKTKPGVLGANTPDLGGAEGGPSSGRSSRGAETSRGATPKGREQGFAGRKLGVKVPRNTSQTFNGGNCWVSFAKGVLWSESKCKVSSERTAAAAPTFGFHDNDART